MNKLMICAMMAFAIVPAMANYSVDLGTPASEAGFTLAGWGDIQPTTSGGTWGGMSGSADGLCRTVWGISEDASGNWASITFPTDIYGVTIWHLDGLADDSFDVYVDGILWGSYADSSSTELWTNSSYSGAAGKTFKIVATGAQWSQFSTYGQLGIDRVYAVPAPGALLLGSMGMGLVGWLRRRRSL